VPTLSDLLVPRDRDTIEAILLSTLQAEKFPVTDWYVGGVARTILKMLATGLLDRETLIGYIAAGGFLDLAAALEDPTGQPIEGWLVMLADQQYDQQRAPATFTRKLLTLTCASGSGPYTRAAGELRAISQSGNYYVNADAITVPDGSSVQSVFQCESPGLVMDATGSIDTLTTPLPGLSVIDAQSKFSVPIQFWIGTGHLTANATGTPSPARTVKVTIVSSGRVGEATAKFDIYSVDSSGVGTVSSVGPFTVAATVTQGDAWIAFVDGPSSTNSFIGGDTWFVSTPGEPTLQNGAEEESLVALAHRCRDRWPSLSLIPTEGKYAAWARQCSVESALGVNRIISTPSTTVAGVLNVYIADATGAATSATVTAVQNYIDKRSVDIERANVASASAVTITVSGIAYAKRSQIVAVKAAAKRAWNAYLATAPIGGDKPKGIVRCSRLDQILQEAGAYNSELLNINSGGTDADLHLSANQVPAASTGGTDDITWYEVP
jgi:hypothetical protein